MKTSTLLITLGLASSGALAQVPSLSQDAEPRSGMPMQTPSHDTSGSSGAQSESGASAGEYTSGGGAEPMSPAARLKPKTENGVTYLCGGVGREEVSYLKREARKHDLALTFATRKGEYLADVNVEIQTANGQPVLQTTCDGPMMLVDLPKSGTYRVRADAGGYKLNQTVSVQHGKGVPIVAVLNWPDRVAKGPGSSATQTGGSGTRGAGSSGGGHSDSAR